ncbi:malonyl-ACP O-methyltransferase BioC [Halalkalibacterium ligniniphilum]|uniref:malonyl-ACP O-methyltransferase BioC n=1 Tax=Halalkalibacterium ligniniphilum TaxID=1134413 RepID=UPI00034755D0|nr:malonyl-ACP O-methyltransferase BioC [Halalkalibacterium ligniniphilum]
MIDKQLLQKRFSQHATTYDQYANVQKRMAKYLMNLIPTDLKKSSNTLRILEVGCGTGYLTSLLSEKFPEAKITAVDLAPGMIEAAKKRLQEKKVSFICGDIEEIALQGEYDVIISNATFQWFNNLENTLHGLLLLLKKEGVLCFSTFGCQTFKELHASFERATQILRIENNSRVGPSFYSLTELKKVCTNSIPADAKRFSYIKASEKEEYEFFRTVRDFFTSIKKIGANNSNQEAYCQRPSLFKELVNVYETNYKENEQIKATYHCLFIKIEKIER